jgi:hypothetical protein
MCQDCGCRLEVVKTMVMDATTQRLRECRCGSRFITTEVVTRKLPALPVTASQPPGNDSTQSSSSGSGSLSLPSQKPDQTQTPARVEPVLRTFPVAGKDSPPWGLTQSFHERLTAAFPGVNSQAEYAKVDIWAEANPLRLKTPRGMKAFLMRWFEKAQNQGPRLAKPALSAVPPWKQAERDEEQRKRDDRNREAAARERIQRETQDALKKAGFA